MEFGKTFRSYLGRCTVNFTALKYQNDPKYNQKYKRKDEQTIPSIYLKGRSSRG